MNGACSLNGQASVFAPMNSCGLALPLGCWASEFSLCVCPSKMKEGTWEQNSLKPFVEGIKATGQWCRPQPDTAAYQTECCVYPSPPRPPPPRGPPTVFPICPPSPQSHLHYPWEKALFLECFYRAGTLPSQREPALQAVAQPNHASLQSVVTDLKDLIDGRVCPS